MIWTVIAYGVRGPTKNVNHNVSGVTEKYTLEHSGMSMTFIKIRQDQDKTFLLI